MYKFVLVLFCVTYCLSESELCSNKKSDGKCVCRRSKNIDTHLIVSIANCANLNLITFPKKSSLRNDINVLDLSFNNISELRDKEYNSRALKHINLNYNSITYIEEYFFQDMSTLYYLDLSYNNLKDLDNIFTPLKLLITLNLSFNNITSLNQGIFSNNVYLKYLDLSHNLVGEQIVRNPLTDYFGINENITHLILNNIGLSYFPTNYFDKLLNLQHVSLADNALEIIPNLPTTIEYLDMSGNHLTFISPHYLDYSLLKTLKLNRMSTLTDIHHYAFYNLKALENLYITDCFNLKQFTDLAFGLTFHNHVVQPKFLVLARNGLRSLNESYKFMFDDIMHIDITGNPWDCNCNILWLKPYAQYLYKKEYIRCASPSFLNNRQIISLTDEDAPQCYPEKYGKKSHRILIPTLIIIVIILLFLILLLIKYAPYWYESKTRGVGPNSPYNVTPN